MVIPTKYIPGEYIPCKRLALTIALVAYGHRVKGDCSDTKTLNPVGPLDSRAYIDMVNRLNPRDMTPLSKGESIE